jgi:CheY-like chemotaxis protein
LLVRAPEKGDNIMASQAFDQGKDRPGSLRVLVADDNRDGANTLAHLLASWGYQVQVVYDGLAALESAQAHPPNVALIDLGLPGMDGYQVALHLRQQPELHSVKLIAVTGFDWPDAPRRSRDYGFDDHFVKPVDPDRLHSLLKRLETRPEETNRSEPRQDDSRK